MSDINEPASIPLPPLPAPRASVQPGLAAARLDFLLGMSVLLLAVFLSLFPVRNSDIWMHLATGRALASGQISLSQDPFSYTASAVYWVNHSWLYDLFVYGVFERVGGLPLLVLKVLLVTSLAALLMAIRRRGVSLWLPALCTALALLAMSSRLFLQPTLASFTLLGLTFFLLNQPELTNSSSSRLFWLLPLFALWVNLDAWFFVGPLAVALYLIGEALQRQQHWRLLALVFLGGLAACLVNPYTYLSWRLPAELTASYLVPQFQDDETFRLQMLPVWQSAPTFTTIAGLAYFPLIVLGLLSFLLNTAGWRWGRVLVWLGFLGLSAYHVRAIPFFAVVAGPITALNLQEFALHRGAAGMGWSDLACRLGLLGRSLSLLAVLVLLVLAWPGWLHGFQQEGRRVGLAMEIDPTMKQVAQRLQQWRREGKLTGHGLNLSPDVANLLAWLCPDEAGKEIFFDHRLSLYPPEVAREYLALRRTLPGIPPTTPESQPNAEPAWTKTFQQRRISHVVVYDLNALRLGMFVRQFVADPSRWVLLHLEGHAAILGVYHPPLPSMPNPYLENLQARGLPRQLACLPRRLSPDPFAGMAYDPAPRAFRTPNEALPEAGRHLPQLLPWWQFYLRGSSRSAPAADDALVHLLYFETVVFPWHYENRILPAASASAASVVGCASTPRLAGLGTYSRLQVPPERNAPLLQVEGPITPVLLAVRRARQAILDNPDNATGFLRLGQAYLHLSVRTAEKRWGAILTPLEQMRRFQAAAAFQNALLLRPDLEEAHAGLVELYRLLNFKDLSAKHLGEEIKVLRRMILPGQVKAEERRFRDNLELKEKELADWDMQVKKLQDNYAVQAEGKRGLEKALIAYHHGLAETALNLLNTEVLDPGGVRMELDLLLAMGRLEELRRLLDPLSEQERKQFGSGIYELYRIYLAAAEGDYTEADRFLEERSRNVLDDSSVLAHYQLLAALGTDFTVFPGLMNAGLWERVQGQFGRWASPAADPPALFPLQALMIAQSLLDQTPRQAPVIWLLLRSLNRLRLYEEMRVMAVPLQQQADYRTLRGILALEAGHPEAARRHFHQAGVGGPRTRMLFAGRPAAAGYLQLIGE
jgi:hypothetical protein